MSDPGVTVTKVVSGNEVIINQNTRVTLAGIDKSEKAKEYLLKNVKGQKLQFVVDRGSSKGSNLNVYLSERNDVSINQLLLTDGLANFNRATCGDSLSVFSRINVTQGNPESSSSTKLVTDNLHNSEKKNVPQKSITDQLDLLVDNVFLIINYDSNGNEAGIGTGFFVDNVGTAVTNYHVFEGGSNWKIKMKGDKLYQVTEIYAYDQDNDFLIFKVDLQGRARKGIRMSKIAPKIGDDIFVLGNPKGLETTLSKGIVSSIRGNHDLIQIDAAISPGSSGSPVLNTSGEVIGLATFQRVDCENCNFAVDINLVKSELRHLK